MVSAATKKSSGKMYRYYACKRNLESGKDACVGYRVAVDLFEKQVLDEVLGWIFSVEHVRALLKAVRKALTERSKPLKELRQKIEEVEKALARYQAGFETGAFSTEDVAKRFRELGLQKRAVEAEYEDRSTLKSLPAAFSRTENIEQVRRVLVHIFKTAPHTVMKRWLHVLIEHVIFQGNRIEVQARNDGVIAVLESLEEIKAGEVAKVTSLGSKWRPQCQAVKYLLLNFEIQDKSRSDNVLRFNPIQTAEWLQSLLDAGVAKSQRGLEDFLGIDQTRIGQFLRLMRLPKHTRVMLRGCRS